MWIKVMCVLHTGDTILSWRDATWLARTVLQSAVNHNISWQILKSGFNGVCPLFAFSCQDPSVQQATAAAAPASASLENYDPFRWLFQMRTEIIYFFNFASHFLDALASLELTLVIKWVSKPQFRQSHNAPLRMMKLMIPDDPEYANH